MLRSVKYGLNAAVLAGLVAAPIVWVSVDKTVQLTVDGHTTTVRTTAADVGQLVTAQGYHVDGHDLLAPAAGSSLHDGSRVVLQRGRLLQLSVDGRPAAVWTTARTVADALGELGYPQADFVSVSRSQRLPLTGTAISIRTPTLITVLHDGRTDQVSTTDTTVGDVLADLDVKVGPEDRLSAPTDSTLHAGQVLRLQRVSSRDVVRTTAVPFDVTRREDSTLAAGKTKLIRAGKPGERRTSYAAIYVDGKLVGRMPQGTRVLADPTTKIIRVGTKPAAGSGGSSGSSGSTGSSGGPITAAPSLGSAQAIAKTLLEKRGWGSQDQFGCLVEMWNHESGWNVHAANTSSGAYGIPQALPGDKMASAGPDWQNDATTQITWGLNYIGSRYGTPCGAWAQWQANGGWY